MADIVFVHGMFQNPKSWEKWIERFSARGHSCAAPAWPLHEGDPRSLRENPPAGLGELTLGDVIARIEQALRGSEKPVMVGHSVGGLITQIMLGRGLISAGIAVNSVAPNAMIDLDGASSRTARSSQIRSRVTSRSTWMPRPSKGRSRTR